jgi:4-hydroxybenzoate polyprenyltransferase
LIYCGWSNEPPGFGAFGVAPLVTFGASRFVGLFARHCFYAVYQTKRLRCTLPDRTLNRTTTEVGGVPLFVDLDGTLVKSDTLVDSLLVLLRTHPALFLKLPGRVLHGKASFKAFVTDSITLDVPHLPYNRKLIKYLQQEHAQGRPIFLATGADERLAQRVAKHLGIFAGVMGSDGATNLIGANKLARLQSLTESGEFDYIGNARPDLSLLAHAREPMVANPSGGLRRGLKARKIHPTHEFVERSHPLKSMLKAIRLHQWAKNLLIFVPLLLAHRLVMGRLLSAALAFFCFSLTASATYIVNDLLDIEADRRHPRKRMRPFASGDLSAFTGAGIVAAFLLLALLGARLLPVAFYMWLLLYLATTLAYSSYLKRIELVDVLVLAGLYTLRLQAGGAATHTPISHWLAGFSIFLFLSLAFVKRFAELQNLRASGSSPKNGRGYLVADLDQLRSFGTASAFASVVVFANYISGREVMLLYHQARFLWLIVPLIVLWICRVWLLASRGELNEDPVIFALRDRTSIVIGVAVVAITLLAI